MRRYLYTFLMILMTVSVLSAQSSRYVVERAAFSSNINDEFSPVYYGNGIVFCSSQKDEFPLDFGTAGTPVFKMFFVTTGERPVLKHPVVLFSKDLTSGFNDGPVTFNKGGDTLYFSRNNSVEGGLKDISDPSNKLGLYRAVRNETAWSEITSFLYNDPRYNLTTPSLTPAGDRLYFSSDMPGGFGGMDLYYCEKRNGAWLSPVNLGPVINTKGNESFPFASDNGRLFFSTDGLAGYGGKDIYFSQQVEGRWIAPVLLDSGINSPADDFGLVTDSTLASGYFSSNRRGTDDIFSFRPVPVDFTDCDSLVQDKYCFTLYDERYQLLDTVPAIYQWDFGDGRKSEGVEVRHCFPGPGNYKVLLNIIDAMTGDTISANVRYDVRLRPAERAYINSYNIGLAGDPVYFDGAVKTNLPGKKAGDYVWDFGKGFEPGGSSTGMVFKKRGEYTIRMGLLSKNDSLGIIPRTCVWKNIRIYNSFRELGPVGQNDKPTVTRSVPGEQAWNMPVKVYVMEDISDRQERFINDMLTRAGSQKIVLDRYGVLPVSENFLNSVAEILNNDADIRLEIAIHLSEDGNIQDLTRLSGLLAGEVSFYFKDRIRRPGAVQTEGLGSMLSLFGPFQPGKVENDGFVEFIFMRTNQ